MISMAHKVGTAPGTSTLYIPNPTVADLRGGLRGGGLGVPMDTGGTGFTGPLGVPMDTGGTGFTGPLTGPLGIPINTGGVGLYGGDLGLIFPPSWKTGRTTTPPGLPGTTVVKLTTGGAAAGLMGPDLGRAFSGPGFSLAVNPWWALLDAASVFASAYHGYKRHDSVGAAIGWGILGGLFPIITPGVALIQGFGKRKR